MVLAENQNLNQIQAEFDLKKTNLSQFFPVECTFGVLFKNSLLTLQLVTLITKLQ